MLSVTAAIFFFFYCKFHRIVDKFVFYLYSQLFNNYLMAHPYAA